MLFEVDVGVVGDVDLDLWIVPPSNGKHGVYCSLTASPVSRPMQRPSPQSEKWPVWVRIAPSATTSAVDVQLGGPVGLAVLALALLDELDAEHVRAGLQRFGHELLLGRDAEEVVDVVQLAVLDEQRVAAEARALGEDHALRARRR